MKPAAIILLVAFVFCVVTALYCLHLVIKWRKDEISIVPGGLGLICLVSAIACIERAVALSR
jgi:hypothetical protein